jgi:hypothetical protein
LTQLYPQARMEQVKNQLLSHISEQLSTRTAP